LTVRIVRNLVPVFVALASSAYAAPQATPEDPVTASDTNRASVAPLGAPRSFADLTERLAPSVVNVSTTQKIEVGKMPKGGASLEELLRRFMEQRGDDGEAVTREATSLGSGFIISADGYVVTNNHVISGGEGKTPVESITVTLADRREFSARVVGRDPLSDLALLKIEAAGLPFVKFGNSQGVRVGDWAIAIGNPFGLGGTVTAGIVSALHRNIGSGQYDRYIQTDASINQGNSGGPLFDLDGNVIGINTVIVSPSGGNVGLGFAIPAELAKPVVDQLRGGAGVKRGYLGVSIQPVSPDIAASMGLPKDRGEIVALVEPTGPAARAGVRQGDVITHVAGQEVTFDNTLSYIVANTPIGSTVPIVLIRDGKQLTVNAKLAQRPTEAVVASIANNEPVPVDSETKVLAGVESVRLSLGVTVEALDADNRRALRLPETLRGIAIASLNPASDAAANGLQRGDVIVQINQQQTANAAEAAKVIDAARKSGRDTVLLLVQRGTVPARFIGIKLLPPKPAK
jgi:serine protease Do